MNPIAAEQQYVDMLFARLDEEARNARQRLAEVQAEVDPANPDNVEALIRRETEYHQLEAKLDKLSIAEIGLVFGRIDVDAQNPENPVSDNIDRRYIGRLGLDDRKDNYRTLLLDWRAPMARPFYLATVAQPEGVHTRRHIRTSGRKVTDIHDEVLQGEQPHTSADVASESALHQALNAPRTGHMSSIVETIQREQDAIIRDERRGVMVVQGGPGTGKTAVALHRAAYLLYTYREQLARTGVLIIGPNRTFLDYISRVLPELGETGTVLSTIHDLYPGFSPTRTDNLLSREIKGSVAMAVILKEAVRAYQHVPSESLPLRTGSITLSVTPTLVKAARTRARRSRKPHNEARGIFREHLIESLAAQLAQQIGADPLGGANLLSAADVDQLHDDINEEDATDELVDKLWPILDPFDVLKTLLSSREAIEIAAASYDDATHEGLLTGPELSTSDTALIDELATLIGEAPAVTATSDWDQELADAEDVLDSLTSSASTDLDDDFDEEVLSAGDIIDAATLASRQEETDRRTTAERARSDLNWAFGHVIIDEAQELTPMEWRMVMRRSPARWLTVVGDPAQTSAPAGVDDWHATLEEAGVPRLRVHTLTVNYRTPQEIMDVAAKVLAVFDPATKVPTSVRSREDAVRYLPAGSPAPSFEGGTSAVVTADNLALHKGLEYDHVIIDSPADIVNASPQGWQDLYVAITRATQTLTIIGEIPV